MKRADCVSLLLRAGADPNASTDGFSALIMAASNGSADVVRMLLEAGASVDVKAPTGPGTGGWTAMDYAYTTHKFAAICPLLLRAGSELPKERPWAEFSVSKHPYLSRIMDAGGFKAYERAHLTALTKTLSPKLAHLLPPELARTVIEFYLHAGFYPFTAAKAPATAPAA